jgi:hypothetical protein
VRALIDPNVAALRSSPRDERDLVIAATNGWVIALDNLSHLPGWLSDGLCRLATGAGFGTRELYSDGEETLFCTQRPSLVNGIEEVATQGDLLDRAIVLHLPTISEHHRRDEKTFWRDFVQAQPRMLGALLDAMSTALAGVHSVQVPILPRMADFAVWSCAAAPACDWELEMPDGEILMTHDAFLAAYAGARQNVHESVLDASPVTAPLRTLLQTVSTWEGTATSLLSTLEPLTSDVGFQQAYRDARRQVLQGAIVLLQASAIDAVQTLTAVMADGTAPTSAKVAAARTVLDTAIRATELESLEERLAELERRLDETGYHSTP